MHGPSESLASESVTASLPQPGWHIERFPARQCHGDAARPFQVSSWIEAASRVPVRSFHSTWTATWTLHWWQSPSTLVRVKSELPSLAKKGLHGKIQAYRIVLPPQSPATELVAVTDSNPARGKPGKAQRPVPLSLSEPLLRLPWASQALRNLDKGTPAPGHCQCGAAHLET